MSPEEQSIRERIVLAAITCIERDGMDALTVRAIAAEAGVNIAAMNYYFGSKEALVQEVLRHTLRTGFSLEELDERIARGMSVREAVEAFVIQYLHDASRYPRLAQAHLYDPFVRGEYPKPLLREVAGFVEGFADRADSVLAGENREDRRRSAMQLWAAVLFLITLPGFFRGAGFRFDDAAERERYGRGLLDRFLIPSSGGRRAKKSGIAPPTGKPSVSQKKDPE